ncbi:MAG: stage V sporulation protein AD [Candidatus Paraimprobicoccus trichonymphae]|uniref:Stage V sporulation protein AD n=1 Tax=Candidatus Paraimprobicoccus trichonymphae TaxID=3033793 RepID=A0AA48KWE6_9FIRM|nr:MAG: stage V sporulation protein AD [Candidatus Paraimprobicoccus trichonymphae]
MPKKLGRYTIEFENKIFVQSFSAVAGKKESEGPLKEFFDKIFQDTTLGEETWEKSESKLQSQVVKLSLKKAKLTSEDIDYIFSGDLLNQNISSTFGLKKFGIPFLGQYGACSTMAQNLVLASIFIESKVANRTLAVTSSHFCSAERQFRFPLEYGGQRTPTAQWTVTGSGSVILGLEKKTDIYINKVTVGKITDLGIKDQNNMGAAMAPAAFETLQNFFSDTETIPEDYDAIFTGDLGAVGSNLLRDLLIKEKNIDISKNHKDCGLIIFKRKEQDVHSGGSGCGCSASVLCSYILSKLQKKEFKNIIFMATGALMSPTSVQQNEPIPGIAHLVNFRTV